MSETNLDHNEGLYVLAIEHGDYRTATRAALRAVRRTERKNGVWLMRLHGAFKRRNDAR